ncbi:hypothetical protein DLM45_12745 [Hyphomicrobium methylovorum]|uniref:mucoidy inhibitor MuiA family protein n=1 Tax=Hyphomicrobium methylovorum TaxID=84 RepID=UPI0015E79D2A|nr:mucoidy inhibitor MuiA family protein [Hyphomicrobium methylovorum]MBA2127081.1 hypothetical protein [Hyphomicrobium methylovorum]
MRFALAAVFVAVLPFGVFAAEIQAPSTIGSVTVFLKGAEITRFAKTHLEKGEHTIVIEDVPASAVPASIRVEGRATGKLDISSVDTARKFLQRAESQAADVQRKSIEDEIEKLQDERAGIAAQEQGAQTQKALIANLAQLPTRPRTVTPGATGTSGEDDWPKILELIARATGDANKLELDAQQKLRIVDRKIADLENRLKTLAPAQTQQTEVRVHVIAQSPLDADFTIRYQVQDANWTPIYDARLQTGTKTEQPKFVLARRAAIRQYSGENWDSVELKLSTARPSDSAAAPLIDSQFVDYEPPPRPRPLASAARLERAESKRERAAGNMADADVLLEAAPAAPPPMPVEAEESTARLEVAPFEATFEVPGRNTVLGTGEGKRVLLMTEDLTVTLGSRSVPKLDTNAYLYAKIKLLKGTPLLPGSVCLFRDGTFVGMTDIPAVAVGEEHDLGFGIDDQVKVKHAVLEEKRGETGLISTSHVDSRNFRVNVKNLHERPIAVTILDRVPVSQNDEIKVEYTGKATPSTKNVDDKRGVIAFDSQLEPDEEKIFEYGYRISWPAAKSIVYGP